MKTQYYDYPVGRRIRVSTLRKIFFFTPLLALVSACHKDDSEPLNYHQVNLVSDVAGYGAARTDPNLVNPWGIAEGGTGALWISSADGGSTVVYDADGNELTPAITIPFEDGNGSPTGVVYNSTSSFMIPSKGEVSKFIYATEEGTIVAWSSGNAAVTVADRSAKGASYKGLAMANNGTGNYLYAANFKKAQIDVFDLNFNYVSDIQLVDPQMPEDFAPFNVQRIDDRLYVTYAKQKLSDREEDEPGRGNGYVNIFTPGGQLIARFDTRGMLNSPWGIAKASSDFGQGSEKILIGNFGDGRINVFTYNGIYKGQLFKGGVPLSIEGLWGLAFRSTDGQRLYFTAGPAEEEHGLFGYINPDYGE